MQAGNHGDEWEGQIGLGNLIRSLSPKDIKGRLVILPSANFPAALEGRRTSPIDEGNLNRSFPGDAEGTITQQIAYWIEHALLPGFDYAFDFHSGGSSLTYIPSALAPRHQDAARMEKVMGLLKAFGAPVSYISAAPQGGGRTFTRHPIARAWSAWVPSGWRRSRHAGLAQGCRGRHAPRAGPCRLLQRPVPAPTKTRFTEIGGDDYYVYATGRRPVRAAGRAGRRGEGRPAGRPHTLPPYAVARARDRTLQARRPGSSANASPPAASAATACSPRDGSGGVINLHRTCQ